MYVVVCARALHKMGSALGVLGSWAGRGLPAVGVALSAREGVCLRVACPL